MGTPQRGALRLRDGSHWAIEGADEEGCVLVSRLRAVMQLDGHDGPKPTHLARVSLGPSSRSAAQSGGSDIPLPGLTIRRQGDGIWACDADPYTSEEELLSRLMALSLVFCLSAVDRGGFLIHGALGEKDGLGVLLTGPSGAGKTTAADRMGGHWQALSDDATLLVPDGEGSWWAHPWPTWSRLFEGHASDTWPVAEGIRLTGIYLLSRNPDVQTTRLDFQPAAMMLLDRVYECSWDLIKGRHRDEARRVHVRFFNSACDLAAAIPCRPLHVTLCNPYWLEIEKDGALDDRLHDADGPAPAA